MSLFLAKIRCNVDQTFCCSMTTRLPETERERERDRDTEVKKTEEEREQKNEL